MRVKVSLIVKMTPKIGEQSLGLVQWEGLGLRSPNFGSVLFRLGDCVCRYPHVKIFIPSLPTDPLYYWCFRVFFPCFNFNHRKYDEFLGVLGFFWSL